MDKIEPGTLCRIVNFPPANNAIVRAVSYLPYHCEWVCEALQHLPGFIYCGVPRVKTSITVRPGQELTIEPKYLKPLYDGDGQDEMLMIAGRPEVDARL